MKNSRKIQIATQILKNLYKFIFMRENCAKRKKEKLSKNRIKI